MRNCARLNRFPQFALIHVDKTGKSRLNSQICLSSVCRACGGGEGGFSVILRGVWVCFMKNIGGEWWEGGRIYWSCMQQSSISSTSACSASVHYDSLLLVSDCSCASVHHWRFSDSASLLPLHSRWRSSNRIDLKLSNSRTLCLFENQPRIAPANSSAGG